MKINVSGHHVEITTSIREHLEEKLSKIATHFPTLISLDVIISKEHGAHRVELSTNYEGGAVATSADDEIMYPAISKASKKLDAALKHRKGQLKANLHSKPKSSAQEVAYERVQTLDLG